MTGDWIRMAEDNWGRDPVVQRMRRTFAGMDRVQETLLNQAGINPFDERLRALRETALNLFDKAVARAADKRIQLTDNARIDIYAGCLQQSLSIAGIAVSPDLLPDDSALRGLVRGGFQ